MRVNTQLLEEKIKKSGIKLSYIEETLGISSTGFKKKRDGKTPFRGSEIYVLCDLLNIADDEKPIIFYP